MTLANVKWGVNGSAVQGLQRNPLIIYPGYPTLELEARSPLAFMLFLQRNNFHGMVSLGHPLIPALCVCHVCLCVCV